MTTAAIEHVNEWEKEPGKVRWYVDFVDGTKAVCFSEQAKELEAGKPLPEGWVVEPPKQEGWNPMLKAPRKGGGGFGGGGGMAAFRNTKEGQAAEQRSIHASVALQHAIARYPNASDEQLKAKVSFLFGILQELSSGGAAVPPLPPPAAASSPASRAPKDEGGSTGGKKAQNHTQPKAVSASPSGSEVAGEGITDSGGVCAHENVTLSKPDGKPLPNGFYRCSDCGHVGRIL